MEDFKEKCSRLKEAYFDGEVTVKKTDLWLVMIICLLMGIIYGLCKAPMTHGVTIGCNNGNSCGCKTDCAGRKEDEEAKEKEEIKEEVKGRSKREVKRRKREGKIKGGERNAD